MERIMTLTASSFAIAHSGQMMTQPLIISDLLEYAAAHHGTREIISRRQEGDIHRYTVGLAKWLERQGHEVTRDQVRYLMDKMGL